MRTLLAVLLLALPLSAQHRESIEVNILELDVVVLDRDGKTVDGLTQDDFEVEIGKRRMGVTNFYAVQRGAIVDERTAGAAPRPAAVSSETILPTTVVIFIDDTRLTQNGKARAIDALKEYVATNVGPATATSAMIVRWNGSFVVRTRPAERAGVIIAELDKMAKEPVMNGASDRLHMLKTIDEAMTGITGNKYMHSIQNAWIQLLGYADRETKQVERTIDALREAAKLASAFEGRKSLLYISEGLPMQPAGDLFDYWERMTRVQGQEGLNQQLMDMIAKDHTYDTIDPMRYDRSQAYQRLSRDTQKMNVHFYGIDVGGLRGLATPGVEEIRRIAQISTLDYRANQQDAIRMVANETGGRFIANENDLGRALAVVSEQFNTYYSLGVSAPTSTRLSKIAVKVKNRPELRVAAARHRKPLSRDEMIERDVRSRLYLLRAENPHGAKIDIGVAANLDGRCVVPVNVYVPRAKVVPVANGQTLNLHFAMLDELHQESEVRKTPVSLGEGDLSHLLTIGVKPGKYMLSLAVADPSTGETSYLQRGIDASGCR